jgi:hypothetical protein
MLQSCAQRELAVGCGDLYERTRQEMIRLVTHLDHDLLTARVPAIPAWRERDVVAHVVGITADLNAKNFGTGVLDEWTTRQVDGEPNRDCEVQEVRGPDGGPPYVVHWGDRGHETLFFPGPDASVQHFDHAAG